MKLKTTMKVVLVTGALVLAVTLPASATLIYAWDFIGLPATTTTTATPGTIAATVGSGSLDVSAFGLGAPQGTSPERTAFTGSTLNAFPDSDSTTSLPTQAALALANSSANGKSIVFSFSMAGYQDLVVSFATRGTSSGFDSGLWSWSTDNSTYTLLIGVNTATTSTTFSVASVDFSTEFGLNNAATAYLKYTLSGATSASGNNRLDNIQFNATPIPEPSTFIAGALLALPFGLQGVRYLRNRKRA